MILESRWRKTRHSNGQGSCVEVANVRRGQARTVAVRDTTDRQGPALAFAPHAWRKFTRTLKTK